MYSIGLWNPQQGLDKIIQDLNSASYLVGLTSTCTITISHANEILEYYSSASTNPRNLFISETVIEISTSFCMALFLTTESIWLIGEDSSNSGLFGSEDVIKSKNPVKLKFEFEKKLVSASISSHHAAVVSEDGVFYTWGEGNDWELGRKESGKSGVKVVENGSFFKAKQVACGEKITGVLTQGGYFYIFGKRVSCKCGGITGYPYSLPALEHHFISKSLLSPFGIVLLTDTGKCFITKGCLCIFPLQSTKSISHLSSFSRGICGLSTDKSRLFTWIPEPNNEYSIEVYKTEKNGLVSIHSSQTNKICLLGSSLSTSPELLNNEHHSREPSPKCKQGFRKSFEVLMGNYNFEFVVDKESEIRNEGCKALVHLITKFLAESFRKVKEFSYFQMIHRKAFVSLFTSNLIGRVVQRFANAHKAEAFKEILKFSKEDKGGKTRIMNRGVGLKIVLAITDGDLDKFAEVAVRKWNKMTDNKKIKEKLSNAVKNPFEISLRIIEKRNFQVLRNMFGNWSQLNSKKNTPVQTLSQILASKLSQSLKSSFSILNRPSIYSPLKYGLYILSSFISNSQCKLKSQTFNTMLRHRSRNFLFIKLKKVISPLLHSKLSLAYNCIKLNKITQKYSHVIQFLMKLQTIQKKIKYRTVIKGFNAFKNILLGRGLASDINSEQSFNHQSFYKSFGTPQCGSPSQAQAIKRSEGLTLETTSTSMSRRASLHTFQRQLVKKVSEKIATESKSSVLKNKQLDKKLNEKNSLSRRNAYNDLLKERQKKKITSNTSSIYSSRKGSFMLSSFDFNPSQETLTWKMKKYESGTKELIKVLEKIRIYYKRLHFNYIKFMEVDKKEEVHQIAIEKKKKTFVAQQKKRRASVGLRINIIIPKNKLLQVPDMGCDSPIISPIARLSDETFPVPPSPFTDLMSPKSTPREINGFSWKSKLLALGLSKFSRAIKLIVFNQLLIKND